MCNFMFKLLSFGLNLIVAIYQISCHNQANHEATENYGHNQRDIRPINHAQFAIKSTNWKV